ncbi:MAG: rRNA maturation RNase YbeY [Gemmatimonadota bacterium]|nr:rRNA maturation RNase YbeY [Gemmatimonadota bacterium]
MSRAPAVAASGIQVGGRLRPLPEARVRQVVAAVLKGERRQAEISVTFLGRDAMRRLNASALGRHYPTDVMAFPLPAPDGALMGDVYLCPWVAARSARRHRIPVRQELVRLIVHGTLHVLGWDHPEDAAARTSSSMWTRQERYVAELA